MFTKSELKSIDTQYFNVLHMGCYGIYLRSINSGHYWSIVCEEYSSFKHYKVYHKHRGHYEYHRHSDARSIAVAVARIKQHDEFQMNGRKSVESPRQYGLCSKE